MVKYQLVFKYVCRSSSVAPTYICTYVHKSYTHLCITIIIIIHILYTHVCAYILCLDPPNQPQFTQCITYSNGHPSLQVLSYVSSLHYQIEYFEHEVFTISYCTINQTVDKGLSKCCTWQNIQGETFAIVAVLHPNVNILH